MARLRVLLALAVLLQGLTLSAFARNPSPIEAWVWTLSLAVTVGLAVETDIRSRRLKFSRIMRSHRRQAERMRCDDAVFRAVMQTRKG